MSELEPHQQSAPDIDVAEGDEDEYEYEEGEEEGEEEINSQMHEEGQEGQVSGRKMMGGLGDMKDVIKQAQI